MAKKSAEAKFAIYFAELALCKKDMTSLEMPNTVLLFSMVFAKYSVAS